ncbi:MAG: ATPase, T2SS/T4P/T4SS family [Bdellovibrionales bacterium]|nr:ATPase, T2SS/T4P/T4SS family [Bdellovibrionales bacterium]
MSLNPKCHLITVSGGKGGVGKSVLSANLALALQKEMRTPVLLIDLDDKSCGDQSVIIGLRPQKTVLDLTRFSGVVSEQNMKNFLAWHKTGLAYLGAVTGPEQSLSGDPALFGKQLYGFSQYFKYIVVDVGCFLSPLQFSVLELSSAVLVVLSPEVLVINQTKRLLNEMHSATLPSQLFQIVINQAGQGVSTGAIANSLRLPVVAVLPKDEMTSSQALQSAEPFVLSRPTVALSQAYHDMVRRLVGGILQKNKSLIRPKKAEVKTPHSASSPKSSSPVSGRQRELTPLIILKMQIHTELIKEMDLKKDLTQAKDEASQRELRNKTQIVVSKLVDRRGQGLSRQERSQVIKQVLDESLGLGPLEELLADPSVTEIMVNGCDQIFCEKNGKIQLSPVTFTSNQQLRNVIERIVTPLGRRIDEKTPYVDARLADGSRVNAVIEPLSIDGPAVTIRKFPQDRVTISDLVSRFGSMTSPMADFFKICVEQGLNVVISGGTGSGKTTLLNVLSSFIPVNERIITVEDAAELQLKQEHVVRLETRPANMEGTGEVSIRDLIRNSLRMRPDRIVVGECRDGAALDMLSAMNTGHDGSMTTVHANNPREACSRLETLCLMAGMDLPIKAIREQVAGAVNLIIQIGRLSDGSRKVKSVTEVVGLQGDTVTLQEIFRFKEEGFDKNRKIIGQFQAMGMIPTFIEKFEQRGLKIPRSLFTMSSSPKKETPSLLSAGKLGPAAKRPGLRGLSHLPGKKLPPKEGVKKVS